MARKLLTPSKRRLWSQHVALYRAVFFESLRVLALSPSLPNDEDKISAELLVICTDLCVKLSKGNNIEVPAPLFQLPCQDVQKVKAVGFKAAKRPDFTCPKFDHSSGRYIFLAIEVKLLGIPTSPSWILNKNYVNHGIQRFDCATHEYGKNAPSGIMLGYIVSMSPPEVLREVNQTLSGMATPPPKLDFTFEGFVFESEQLLIRSNVRPQSFTLSHIWTDLRQCTNKLGADMT